LLLTGTRRELDQALALLAQVDTPAPQVSIEAVISDISPETIGALGIDWNAPLTTVQITETAGDGLKFGSFDRRGMTLNAAVEAIRTDSRSKLLAQPNVATVEGMGARILSGQRIPYETRNIIGGEVVVSVQFEQVGVNLMITPKVPLDGQVEARIRAEVSSFQAFTSSGFPIVSTREAEATVRVADGGIIAIGGLMREEELATLRKVPFLSDIPILGELFKFRSQTKRLTELVILISCRVLPDKE
jgi:type II secretory pathway component GspD/PulD (secretin)